MGFWLALGSMLCFASNIMISRYAVSRMHVDSGFFIVLGVNIVFATLLFWIEIALRASPFAFRWKEAGLFAAGGVVGAFLGRRLLFDAVRLLGPARASVFHSTAPVPTLFFAWLLVGETLRPYDLALMAVVLTGLWITQPAGKRNAPADADRAALRRGALLGILTVTGFGASNALRGLAMRTWEEAVFGALLGAAAAFLMQIVTTRDWPRVAAGFRNATRGGYALYIASGVATVCGAILLIQATHSMEIALAALITHTTPVAIFPISLLVLRNREGLTLRTLLGVALVLLGIALLALR